MTEQPIIRAHRRRSLFAGGHSDAEGGFGSLARTLNEMVEQYPHDEAGLLRALHHRVQVAKGARRRSRWFGGRFYNWMSREDPDYVQMSGTHLRQTLTVAGIETPAPVVPAGEYLLRLDVAEKARDLLLARRDRT